MRVALLLLAACRIDFDPHGGDGGDGDVMLGEPVDVTFVTTGTAGTIGGAPCSNCTVSLPAGTQLVLEGVPAPDQWFRGWTTTCGGRHQCSHVVTQPVTITADFTPEPNRIFVTSVPSTGAMGGLAGADATCNSLAGAAGLTGSFRALLSSITETWQDRFSTARGFIRPDGEPYADEYSELGGVSTFAPLRIAEDGTNVGDLAIWAPYYVSGESCSDWTTTAGQGRSTGTIRAVYQSGGGSAPCTATQRFLCAQYDRVVPVDPVPEPGRRAFTAVTRWSLASGVAAADTICANEATTAGFTGTFRALLARPGMSPLARFDLDRPPWVRPDGMRLLATARAWETAQYFDVAPMQGARATDLIFFGGIVTGTNAPSSVATLATTCNDWTGVGDFACPVWTWELPLVTFDGCLQACAGDSYVLCLEE